MASRELLMSDDQTSNTRRSEVVLRRKYSPYAGKARQSAQILLVQALLYSMQARLQQDTGYCHLPRQRRPVSAPSEQSIEFQTSSYLETRFLATPPLATGRGYTSPLHF